MEESTTEVPVVTVFCVVYVLENTDWKVTGHGWAQVNFICAF